MQNNEGLSLFTSVIGGAAIGLTSGLFGALARALALPKVPAPVALLTGIVVGAGAGVWVLLTTESWSVIAMVTCAIFGALVPICSASRLFIAPPDSDVNPIYSEED